MAKVRVEMKALAMTAMRLSDLPRVVGIGTLPVARDI
jgi:hypothetical protein